LGACERCRWAAQSFCKERNHALVKAAASDQQASRLADRLGGAMGESPQYLIPLVAGNKPGRATDISLALHGEGPPRQLAHEPRQGDEI